MGASFWASSGGDSRLLADWGTNLTGGIDPTAPLLGSAFSQVGPLWRLDVSALRADPAGLWLSDGTRLRHEDAAGCAVG